AVAEITGTAAQGRIVLAAPLTLAQIEAQFADRIESRDEITFDAASASLRARRLRRLGAIALAEQPLTVVADDASARMLAQAALPPRHAGPPMAEAAAAMARPGHVPARGRRRRMARPVGCRARRNRRRLARARARRQDRARRTRKRRLRARPAGLAAVDVAPP